MFTFQRRGLGPLLVIAVGVGLLAWVEHSRSLAVFAAAFLGLAALANLYDIENEAYRLGWNLPGGAAALPNLVIPGLMLVGGGMAFWWVDRHALRRSGGMT